MQRSESIAATWFLNPWMDRFSAGLIAALSGFLIYRHQSDFSLLYVIFLISQLQIIITVLARRPAKRIETNPWIVILSISRMIWPVLYFNVADPSAVHLVDHRVSYWISCMLIFLVLLSRVSLGRSLGSIPANRRIVTHGAYAVVRHPIQTLEVLLFYNFLLGNFSLKMACMAIAGTIIFYLKSTVEEQFLSQDQEYQEYKQRVQWRFIPFVI